MNYKGGAPGKKKSHFWPGNINPPRLHIHQLSTSSGILYIYRQLFRLFLQQMVALRVTPVLARMFSLKHKCQKSEFTKANPWIFKHVDEIVVESSPVEQA
jgi:hypothetical protein